MYTARWLTFAGLGMLQGLIAALGNLFLIGTYVVNKPLYLLFAMMLSLTFVSILYALISLFGNIGKGIGIIILVLSISGAGGNFPVVLSGKFFQMINPWLPFHLRRQPLTRNSRRYLLAKSLGRCCCTSCIRYSFLLIRPVLKSANTPVD